MFRVIARTFSRSVSRPPCEERPIRLHTPYQDGLSGRTSRSLSTHFHISAASANEGAATIQLRKTPAKTRGKLLTRPTSAGSIVSIPHRGQSRNCARRDLVPCITMHSMRIVAHIDMDAFYAAVEERDTPRFRGLPLAVGADPEGGKGRGVVAAANYKARAYGIHSAMPISTAWRLSEAARP